MGMNRGWFGHQGANRPRWRSISWKVRGPERNLPRWESISRTVRSPKRNRPRRGPISRKVQIPEGEPSTLEACIADGSGIRGRTVHAGGRYHGRFGVQSGTFHAEGMNRGWCGYQGSNRPRWRSISRKVRGPERNLPRWGPISRMVQISEVEPSTLGVDIMDGAESKADIPR